MKTRSRFWLGVALGVVLGVPSLALADKVAPPAQDTIVPLRVIRDFGVVTLDLIDQLRAELWIQVPALQPDGADMLPLSPAEVISERSKYPDMAVLAGNKMCSIQRLTLGTAPELVAVGALYVDFFEGVVRGAWDVTLKHRLRKADEALKKLGRQTLARKIYLDEFETKSGTESTDGTAAIDPVVIPGLEKNPIDLYLDAAEKKFDTQKFGKGE